jgi:Bacterial Ig-like domain (group 2)/Abnormal spindle-like microcephaly-assoc'd, ASPM-SPD-2-Hydin
MKSHSRLRLIVSFISLIALTLLAVVPANAQTASRTYPNTALGDTSAPQTLTLSNLGILPVVISSIGTSGDFAQTNNCGKTLTFNASCSISVTFHPSALGTRTGVLTAKTTGGTATANLSGTGVAPATVSPTTLSFGNVNVGSASAAQVVTLTNAMSETLTVKSVTTTGDYSQTNNCGSLASGGSCTVNVIFKPTTSGNRTGTLSVTDNALNSPQTAALTGAGVTVTLKSIALAPASPTVLIGKTQQLTATGTYSNGTVADLTSSATWASNKTTVASVSKGLATAVAAGSATISAAVSGVTGTTVVTVPAATLVSIAVSPANAAIAKAKTQQYAAVGTYSDGTTKTITTAVTWSATANATITTAGLATGSAVGTSTITATSGSISGSTGLTITPPALSSITLSPTTASITTGATQQFVATGKYADGSSQTITSGLSWSSTAAATIDGNGMATGMAAGTATVTAASGTIKATASLTVKAPTLVSIAVSPATASIIKGQTQQYTAVGTYSNGTTQTLTSVTWSATTGATIASSGLATGSAAGTSTITATSGTIKGTASLTVTTVTLVSIAVSPATASIPKGQTQQYSAVGTYSDGSTQTLTASWSATTGATIASNGLATASAVGTSTITATSGSIKGTASLTVQPAALVSIAVSPATASIPMGLTQQYTATGTYTDGTTQNLTASATWSASAGESIGAGLATGVAQGAASITATSGTITGTASLTVQAAALTAITVSPASASIPKGLTQAYGAMGTYTDGSTQTLTSVTWSAVGASINAGGVATGTVQGAATISAASGSIKGTASLTVLAPALTAVSVTPAVASIPAGSSQQFAAQGTYTDGSTQNLSGSVIWAVDSGASISGSGLATSLVQGPATVSATSGTISGSASLTVLAPALTSIAVSPFNASVVRGTTQQFSAQGTYTDGSTQDVTGSVTWSASNGATITSGGMATATVVGVPVITATSGSIAGSAPMSVVPPAIASITVSPISVSTGLNGQQQFTATATYVDGTTGDITNSVAWSSGNASVVTVSGTGFAQAVATAGTAIPIMATSGGVTSNPAWFSALASLPMICPTPTIDMKLLVVTNGQTEADFPAIKQILDYVGTPYTVFDMSVNTGGITADMLSDGSCHGYYQGVIFAFGNYIYTLPGMSTLTSYEQLFKIRQVNWFLYPGTDFGFNTYNNSVSSGTSYNASFTPAAAQVFSYANTNTPLTISNAFIYLATPNDGSVTAIPDGATITPLLVDGSGNALSAIYDFGDGRQYLSQTFDSNQYLTHDLVLAYGLMNWVTKGVFLGEYHVYASASVDDFFISDAEWIPGTSCTNPITHDRTASDDPSLPTYRLHAADMAALSNWQNKLNQDPLLSNFKLSLAFNGVGTAGNTDWTGVSAPGVANDDLVSDLQSYQQYFHWLSHTYDHPETLDGLCKSTGSGTGCGDAANIAEGYGGIDYIDLEVLTNLWVAGQTTEATGIAGIANLDFDQADAGLAQLSFTDYDAHGMITPGVTGLDDANVTQYLYQDGVFNVVSDTSVTPTATNNNGPNPSPNVGIVNIYAPIYEVPRHANDIFYNVANWNDDAAEFHCLYGPAGTNQSPYNNYNGAQILDYVSSSFVNNMLLGDMDPQMFHQPNLGAYDGTHSLISDTYDMTFSKYEAVYKLPVLSPTQSQTAQLMQERNNYNLSQVTASYVGGSNPTINISIPAGSTVSAATIPVTGLNSTGAEVYGASSISHITVNNGQTVTVPAQ